MDSKTPAKFDINKNRSNFYMKSVEIIIPFHNHQASVMNLIDSIFRTVITNRYLITLVDDGSDNKDFKDALVKGKMLENGVRYLRTDEQKGFGAAVNYALKNPPKQNIPYICVMQSDTKAENLNWLENLGESLIKLKDKKVKMVSPMTNCSLIFQKVFEREISLNLFDDIVLTEAFIPMYCFLCHRELFNQIGQFQEFPYAGTECEEFAIRMTSKGYFQGLCGSSWIHHQGRLTLKDYDNKRKIQEILRNARIEYFSKIKR
jgi:GT2 family glycosyltransferase